MHVKERQSKRGMSSMERCPPLSVRCLLQVGPSYVGLLGNKSRACPGSRAPSPLGLSGTAATINKARSVPRNSGGCVGAGDVAQPRADTATVSWGSGNASEELMSADTKSCGCLCKQGTAARRKDQSWDIHPKPQISTPGCGKRRCSVSGDTGQLPRGGTQGRVSCPPTLPSWSQR